ncbi:MAG: alpha/beta hydrolase [Pyrinomonadaceae bacterium]|nr:alpha/beta hydrolase [Pyrinomonadaceae bacterium]
MLTKSRNGRYIMDSRMSFACDYTCIALDLRGFGDSKGPTAASYTVKDYADDVAALLNNLELKTFAIEH